MFKGLIFDLDGTLVDSLAPTLTAFNQAIVEHGGRSHTPQEIVAHFGLGEEEIFARILGRERAIDAYETFRAQTRSDLGQIPLHDGVPELLDGLKTRGIPVSIVTGRGWNTTEMILNHHGVLDRFVTVICHDHVSAPKPAPEGIQLALKRMKLEPHDAAYVGDMGTDMLAARLAGTSAIGALWDLLCVRKDLEKHSPRMMLEHPRELGSLFE